MITAPVVKKQKDPKRVAMGHKLQAISKQAKENKARRKFESEQKAASGGDVKPFEINYGFVFGIVGTTAAVASAYYAWQKKTHLCPKNHKNPHNLQK